MDASPPLFFSEWLDRCAEEEASYDSGRRAVEVAHARQQQQEQQAPAEQQKSHIRQPVDMLPREQINGFAGRPMARQMWEKVRDSTGVVWKVMETVKSGGACTYVIEGLVQALQCSFKIGVSSDPVHRFFNKDYGYHHLGAIRMLVLYRCQCREQTISLERELIGSLKLACNKRCKNEKPGGEGLSRSHGGWWYVYISLWC